MVKSSDLSLNFYFMIFLSSPYSLLIQKQSLFNNGSDYMNTKVGNLGHPSSEPAGLVSPLVTPPLSIKQVVVLLPHPGTSPGAAGSCWLFRSRCYPAVWISVINSVMQRALHLPGDEGLTALSLGSIGFFPLMLCPGYIDSRLVWPHATHRGKIHQPHYIILTPSAWLGFSKVPLKIQQSSCHAP